VGLSCIYDSGGVMDKPEINEGMIVRYAGKLWYVRDKINDNEQAFITGIDHDNAQWMYVGFLEIPFFTVIEG